MPNIALQRLFNQQLEQTTLKSPPDVVNWLGAVQSQEYAGAKWALGLRLQGFTDDDIEPYFTAGTILRTHVMRPTWHFVTPADIRWILDLTAPRVHAVNAYMYRKCELDDAIFQRSNEAIAKALQGGNQLTRAELAGALAQVSIEAEGVRLSYVMMHAELDGVICSGARRGKQFTYALVDERAPHARILERDEALAELTQRYFTSHGPATVDDFAWWSGLTKADVRAGLDMVGLQFVHEDIDGKIYWFAESTPVAPKPSHIAYLLPTYDELIIGYTDRSALFDATQIDDLNPRGRNMVFDSMIVIDGQIVGSWRRTFGKDAVVIETQLLKALNASETDAIINAAQRFGAFLQTPVEIELSTRS
jgi:hypothetical protein